MVGPEIETEIIQGTDITGPEKETETTQGTDTAGPETMTGMIGQQNAMTEVGPETEVIQETGMDPHHLDQEQVQTRHVTIVR